MKEFGRRYFKNVAYVRFDNSERARSSFSQDFDIPRLLETISIESKCVVNPKNTLIILDEIQECSAALTSLKYFCEEASEYAIVAAGSLFGVADHVGTGFPVGKVDLLELVFKNPQFKHTACRLTELPLFAVSQMMSVVPKRVVQDA